jgi:hypothetical protein
MYLLRHYCLSIEYVRAPTVYCVYMHPLCVRLYQLCVTLLIINSRFDLDGDNKVDLLNFLNFFLSKDNKEKRTATRVSYALEALKNYALSMQSEKLKVKNINTTANSIERSVMQAYVMYYVCNCQCSGYCTTVYNIALLASVTLTHLNREHVLLALCSCTPVAAVSCIE